MKHTAESTHVRLSRLYIHYLWIEHELFDNKDPKNRRISKKERLSHKKKNKFNRSAETWHASAIHTVDPWTYAACSPPNIEHLNLLLRFLSILFILFCTIACNEQLSFVYKRCIQRTGTYFDKFSSFFPVNFEIRIPVSIYNDLSGGQTIKHDHRSNENARIMWNGKRGK